MKSTGRDGAPAGPGAAEQDRRASEGARAPAEWGLSEQCQRNAPSAGGCQGRAGGVTRAPCSAHGYRMGTVQVHPTFLPVGHLRR